MPLLLGGGDLGGLLKLGLNGVSDQVFTKEGISMETKEKQTEVNSWSTVKTQTES